jgi:hypothetical protein
MPFKKYLKTHYAEACALQKAEALDADVVQALRAGVATQALMQSWMRRYGLFQGISGRQRTAVVAAFLGHVDALGQVPRPRRQIDAEALFASLHAQLYQAVPRSWMSATSKLLWCLHPREYVIYDAFVHRALIVLQRVDPVLAEAERIGSPPKIEQIDDTNAAAAYYVRYQNLVLRLLADNQAVLQALKARHKETYPYDVRIIDKILWMIGSPNPKY